MGALLNNKIIGSGSYIPSRRVRNEAFLEAEFYETDQRRLSRANQEITDKFFEITTIEERRYVEDHLNTSDIAAMAGADALAAASVANLVASITIQQIGTTGTASPRQVLDRWSEVRRG